MRLLERTNLDVIYEAELHYLRTFHPKVKPPPLQAFRARYEDAPGVSFMDGERCVGGIVVKDRLAHIGVLPEFQGGWARLWPAAYDWMFGVSDPVYALMQPANRKVVALVRRTGGKFVKNVKVPQMGSMMLYELRRSTTPFPKSAQERRLARLGQGPRPPAPAPQPACAA